MRLLVAEHDMSFQTFLRDRLREKCFAVDTAADGVQASRLARDNAYDLILLGHTLPEKCGQTVCREIRTHGRHVPIIMMSERAELSYKLESFSAGVDDLITKPFYFEELHARIAAILRRPREQKNSVLTCGDLSLDRLSQKVFRGKTRLYLTRKEFALLEILLHNVGTVVSRANLFEHVWESGVDILSHTIETHMLNLRKKVDSAGKRHLIHSVSGRGYTVDRRK